MPQPPASDRLDALGWDAGWAAAFARAPDGLVPGRAIEIQRGHVLVDGGDGAWPAPTSSSLRGGTRAFPQPGPPATGDWVAVEPGGAVRGIVARRSVLRRFDEVAGDEALVANADLVIVVTSLNADLNLARLERMLAIADEAGVPRLVGLSKADLAEDPDAAARRVAGALGAEAIAFSARTGMGMADLRERLRPRATTALIGSSGVGKSTLVNRLLGHEARRTLEIREDDAKGRHATTSRTLLELPDGALVVDTPGIRSPRPAGAGGLGLTFADVVAAARECRFADCRHEAEPGCGVEAAIAAGRLDPRRLESLRKLEGELAAAADPQRAARRRPRAGASRR